MGRVNLCADFTHAGMWYKTDITPALNQKAITGETIVTLLFIHFNVVKIFSNYMLAA